MKDLEDDNFKRYKERRDKEDIENAFSNSNNTLILDKEELKEIEEATLQKRENDAAKETLRKQRKKQIMQNKEDTLKAKKLQELYLKPIWRKWEFEN